MKLNPEIIKEYKSIVLELIKVRITFFVAVSVSIGYILFAGELSFKMILPALGVFLLASGSSAFNHFQERDTDALMDRTKGRPIPARKITPTQAFTVASIFVLSGTVILYFSSNLISTVLGLIALVWYNIVYTPMKKKYALAVVPGSVIGAIPPVIGWTAAGGSLFNPEAIALAMFFFIWQIPHFWLLLLIFSKDYEKAGFPTLTKVFTNKQLSRITFVWIAALAISCLFIPFFSISANASFTTILLIALGAWLIFKTKDILADYLERRVLRKAFLYINVYVLVAVFILSIDKLLLTDINRNFRVILSWIF